MKKLVAMLLALIMALSCTAVFAEETEETAPAYTMPELPAFTAYYKVNVDEEALSALVPMLGMDESAASIISMVLPFINNLSAQIAFKDFALQADVLLKDVAVATVAGRLNSENGKIEAVSNILPSYMLTVKLETIQTLIQQLMEQMQAQTGENSIDMEALMTSVQTAANEALAEIQNAITVGEPEEVEYSKYDVTFTAKAPITVDVKAVAKTMMNFVKTMVQDEKVASLIASSGKDASEIVANIDESIARIEATTEEQTPTFSGFMYKAETGEMLAELELDTKDQQTGVVNFEKFTSDNGVLVKAVSETAGIDISLALSGLDTVNAKLDATINGMYFGAQIVAGMAEEGAQLNADIYFMNADKPLINCTLLLAMDAEITADFSGEGKEELTVEEIMANQESIGKLQKDVTENGLAALLSGAMQAMPDEISKLLTTLMPSQMQVETETEVEEAVEEAEEDEELEEDIEEEPEEEFEEEDETEEPEAVNE